MRCGLDVRQRGRLDLASHCCRAIVRKDKKRLDAARCTRRRAGPGYGSCEAGRWIVSENSSGTTVQVNGACLQRGRAAIPSTRGYEDMVGSRIGGRSQTGWECAVLGHRSDKTDE